MVKNTFNIKSWSIAGVMNDICNATKRHPAKVRDYISPSDLGKNYWDRYQKMNGVEPTNPFSERTLRVFSAGDNVHSIMTNVFKAAGILIDTEQFVEIPETKTTLKLLGKYDVIAGGKADEIQAKKWCKQMELNEFFTDRVLKIAQGWNNYYPNGSKKLLYEFKSVNCLPAGQLLYSPNGKRILIENIKIGNKVISVDNNFNLKIDKVKNVIESGKKQIYKITTQSGRTVECSGEHKFLSPKIKWQDDKNINNKNVDWIEARNLKIGNKVCVPKKYPNLIKSNKITENQALLLGWIIGDGTIDKRYQSSLALETEKEAEFIKKIADSEFNLDCSMNKYNTNIYHIKFTGGVKNRLGRYNRSNKMILWLELLKFNPKGKDKFIPKIVFESSNEVIAKCLSGLFQSDGYSSKNSEKSISVGYNTISNQLAYDVQHLLLRLGILSSVREYNHKASGFRTKNNLIYEVAIRNIDLRKFNNLIGFYFHKKNKLNNLLKEWKPRDVERKTDVFFDKIKTIERIGFKETYDIEVESDNHNFCVNDFVTHNSQVFWAKKDYLQQAYPWHTLQCYAYLKATGLEEGRVFYISKDDWTTVEFPVYVDDPKLSKIYEEDMETMTKFIRSKKEPPRPDNIVYNPRKKLRFQKNKVKHIINGCFDSNWEIAWSQYFTLLTKEKDVGEWSRKLKGKISDKNSVLKDRYIKINNL